MKVLLDTHALIWFLNGDNQLPEKVKALIEDTETKCFISIASIWEIGIKISLDKLKINGEFEDIPSILNKYEIGILPISIKHIQKLIKLKFHHRDPFDRIIISQAFVEKFSIITKDENFNKYKVKTLWK